MAARRRLGTSAARAVSVGIVVLRMAGVPPILAQAPSGARPDVRETQQIEGEALLALADAALAGRSTPSDIRLEWHNDFLKAQQGTFVPFTVVVESPPPAVSSALLYVRAVPRSTGDGDQKRSRPTPAVDAIVPVRLEPAGDGRARVARGFSVPPGDYDVAVVVRERVDPAKPKEKVRSAALVHTVLVPDYADGQLATSSIMLADRLDVLGEPVAADDLSDRPYAIGRTEVRPALDTRFSSRTELIVVFLVYNATVTPDRRFDVDVQYHFFRRGAGQAGEGEADDGSHPPARDGEAYFNHTEPQRFTPETMGDWLDADHPVMAGQGIPLAGFARGDYRLGIVVTDRLSGQSVQRDVTFSVGSPQ